MTTLVNNAKHHILNEENSTLKHYREKVLNASELSNDSKTRIPEEVGLFHNLVPQRQLTQDVANGNGDYLRVRNKPFPLSSQIYTGFSKASFSHKFVDTRLLNIAHNREQLNLAAQFSEKVLRLVPQSKTKEEFLVEYRKLLNQELRANPDAKHVLNLLGHEAKTLTTDIKAFHNVVQRAVLVYKLNQYNELHCFKGYPVASPTKASLEAFYCNHVVGNHIHETIHLVTAPREEAAFYANVSQDVDDLAPLRLPDAEVARKQNRQFHLDISEVFVPGNKNLAANKEPEFYDLLGLEEEAHQSEANPAPSKPVNNELYSLESAFKPKNVVANPKPHPHIDIYALYPKAGSRPASVRNSHHYKDNQLLQSGAKGGGQVSQLHERLLRQATADKVIDWLTPGVW